MPPATEAVARRSATQHINLATNASLVHSAPPIIIQDPNSNHSVTSHLSVPLSHQSLTPEGIRRPGVVPLRRRGTRRRRLVVLGRGELGASLRAVVHRWPGRARVVHRGRRRHALHVIPGWVLLVVAGAVVGVGALRVGVARVDARQLGAGDEPLYEGRARVSIRCTCTCPIGRWDLKEKGGTVSGHVRLGKLTLWYASGLRPLRILFFAWM